MNQRQIPLWHAARLLFIAIVAVVSVGCAISSDVALPQLPNAPIRGFNITTTTLTPNVAFATSPYSATITTFGGVTPLTNCGVNIVPPAGFTVTGFTAAVNPANSSQCLITATSVVVTPAPPSTGIVVQVQVGAADSSTPALTDVENYTLTIQPGFAIVAFMMANGTEGRPYNLAVSTTLGTGGVAPINAVNGCVVSTGALPTGMNIARNPGNTNQCLFSGTPAAGTAGTYNIAITARDSAGTPNVATFPAAPTTVTLVINPPLAIPAYAPTSGMVNAPYATFTVPTTGGQVPVTCSGTAPAGLTIGTAGNGRDCTITGTPTAAVVNGAVSVTVTDSATATTASGNATVGSTLTVVQAATTTTITNDTPDPTATGESYTVSWTVSAVAPAADAPTAKTGNVTVTDGEGNQCVAAVAVGSCTITNPVNTTGLKTLTATYAGDANFTGSNGTTAHTVQGASTTTTITSDAPDPSVVGQPYTINVTVDVNAPGTGTPTGSVNVDDGSGNTCVVTLAAGPGANQSSGSCLLTSTTAGPKTVTGAYTGDANFNASADTEAHTVNQAATTTLITADANDPSVTGEIYTVSATVSVTAPGAGTPTGSVAVDDGLGNVCLIVLAAGPGANQASGSCMVASTTAGAKTLNANYAGDANFTGSVDTEAHTVNAAPTTTTITADNNDPSQVGEAYTVSLTVDVNAPGAGVPTGTVAVNDGLGNTCNAILAPGPGVNQASGSCLVTSNAAGAQTLTANYPGDGNFAASVDTEAHTVAMPATVTTVTDTVDPTVTGQSYTVNVTVDVVPPGSGTPTGTVVVADGIGNTCNALLAPGPGANQASGSCLMANNGAVALTLTATYPGDANFAGSVDTEGHTANQASTTTTLLSSVNPSVSGQVVTFTATVAVVPPGAGTPTGSVQFLINGLPAGAPVGLVGNSATLNQAFTVLGNPYAIDAIYLGDLNFSGSSTIPGGTVLQAVNQAASTTTLVSSQNPGVSGQNINFTATVTANPPGAGIPTGSVQFTIDGNPFGPPVVLVGGVATSLTTTFTVAASPKSVQATYLGDVEFSGSLSNTVSQVTNQSGAVVIVATPSGPTVTGETYTVGVTVGAQAPGGGTPTGTVNFDDGTGGTCTVVALAGGVGNCLITSTSAGVKTITATYLGDTEFTGAVGTANHTVNQAATTTIITNALTISTVSTSAGEMYAVDATVTANPPGAGTPTGTVNVSDGAGSTCLITLAGGSGTCMLASFAVGNVNVTATYVGDANFTGSVSGAVMHTVTAANTTTTITADTPDPSRHGESYLITVTVAPVPPAAGTPTGTVNVSDGVTPICVVTLAGGTGSCSLNTFPVGTYNLTASYLGDGNYAASVSGAVQHDVIAADTTTTVLSPGPTVTGQQYTATATVTVTAPGTLQTSTITGSIVIDDGTGGTCTIPDVTVGTTCMITSTTAGSKTLTGTFTSTSANFNSSVGTTAHTVNQAVTTTTIQTKSIDPTVSGEDYDVTVTVVTQAPGAGEPLGTVTVSDDDTSPTDTCVATLVSNGVGTNTSTGTCTILNSRSAGNNTDNASALYNEASDPNFATSTSAAFPHTVNRAPTGFPVTPVKTNDPTVVGETYTVSVIVNGGVGNGTGQPSGTVDVDDGFGATCTITLAPGPGANEGQGSCMLASTTINSNNLSFTYNGDADFNSVSTSLAHTVNPANTTTTITMTAPNPSALNQAVTINFTVTTDPPGSGTPTGTVTVDDGTLTCGPVALVGGAGSCMITFTTGGTKALTATFSSATSDFNNSVSAIFNHTVALTVTSPAIGNMTESRAVTTPAVFTTDSAVGVTGCVATPALPAGVTLTPNGNNCDLAGTPGVGTAGLYVFTVTATDNNGDMGTSPAASLTINPPLAITPASPLTNSRQNSTYTLAIGSTGGEPTRTVANPTGDGATTLNGADAECAGMFFNAGTQQIEGTPTATGVCSFNLDVTDTATTTTPAATDLFAYQITVDPAMSIPSATLKNALRNSPYASANITVNGSLSAVSWTVTSGDFSGTTGNGGCAGLSVGASGATTSVTGTPTSAGPSATQSATCGTGNAASSTFTLQASDTGAGPVGPGTATQTFSIIVFGTWLYVADTANDTVEVIDSTSNAHVATITSAQMNTGLNPHSVAISPDGSRAFVTLEGSDSIAVINTFDNTVAGTVDVSPNPAGNVDSCTGPRGIAIGAAGNALNRVYVACTNNNVDVLSATGAVGAGMRIETVNSISTGGQPRDLAVHPLGTFVYVSMSGDRHIEMIDTTAGTLTGTELTDVMPVGATDMRGVVFSANGARLYITDQATDDIYILETASDTVNTGLTITFADGNPERAVLSGGRVYITTSGTTDRLVVLVDGATPAHDTGSPVILTVGENPVGVAVPPSGGMVYLALSGTDSVARRSATTPFGGPVNIALPGAVASTPQGMASMPIPQ